MPNKQVLWSSLKWQTYWWIEFSPTSYCSIDFSTLFLINRECPELLAMTVLKVGHEQTWQRAEFIREVFAGALIHYPSIVDFHLQWERWVKVPNTSRWHSGSQRKGSGNSRNIKKAVSNCGNIFHCCWNWLFSEYVKPLHMFRVSSISLPYTAEAVGFSGQKCRVMMTQLLKNIKRKQQKILVHLRLWQNSCRGKHPKMCQLEYQKHFSVSKFHLMSECSLCMKTVCLWIDGSSWGLKASV